MNIKELKEFLATLPEEFDNYILVNGEYGTPTEPMEGKGIYFKLDKPIMRIFVNETDKALCLLNQSDEEIAKVTGGDDIIEDDSIEEFSLEKAIKDRIVSNTVNGEENNKESTI
jgi:hypothetical protein